MKRTAALLCLVSLISLSGCNNGAKNERAIISFNSYEHEVVNLDANQIEYMVNNNYSFPLLTYTEECSACIKARNTLNEVMKDIKYASYEIEMSRNTVDSLSTTLPDIFSKEDIYPALIFIKDKKISYKSPLETLTNAGSLKKLLNAYSLDTNITTLTYETSFNEYKEAKKNFLVYTFDSSSSDSLNIYQNYIKTYCFKNDKNMLFIDKSAANMPLISEINTILEKEKLGLIIYENTLVKSCLKCTSDIDEQTLVDYLLTFF